MNGARRQPQQQQPEIRFHLDDLSGQEIDEMMAALLERPMKSVFNLFGKLQGQVREQLEAAQKPRTQEAGTGNGVDKEAAPAEGTAKECQPSQPRKGSSAGTR